MKAVGIRQLKARLSEYLRLVKAGETILVTDREEVVAELRKANRQPLPANSLEDILDALAQSGEITRASLPKANWTWSADGMGLPSGTAATLLDQLRSEHSQD